MGRSLLNRQMPFLQAFLPGFIVLSVHVTVGIKPENQEQQEGPSSAKHGKRKRIGSGSSMEIKGGLSDLWVFRRAC